MLNNKYINLTAAMVLAGSLAANADIRDTIQAAKSGTTVTCSGTYYIGSTIQVPSGVTVAGPATFWMTNSTQDGISVPAGNNGVTLKSLTIRSANHGIMIYGANNSIQSCIAQYNNNSGIEITGSSAKNNTLNNCTSKYNADSSGGNADGFSIKFSSSTGNTLTSCISHDNSDDGYDLCHAGATVTLSGCQAYNNGYYNGHYGDGDGFKLGISGDNVAHSCTSCTAYSNTAGGMAMGFDSNGDTGNTHLYTCHSYSNKNKDRLTYMTLSNCTMEQ